MDVDVNVDVNVNVNVDMHVERLEWKAAKSVPPKRTQRLKVLGFDAEFPENGTCKCTWPSCESYVVILEQFASHPKSKQQRKHFKFFR